MSRQDFRASWKGALLGALLCAGLGLMTLALGQGSLKMSYDLLFRIHIPKPPPEDVIMVYMDDVSFNFYKERTAQTWDLNLHADLLDRMTKDGARVVVFDVIFDLPSTTEQRTNFVRAIRQNGKVVLAAASNTERRIGFRSSNLVQPWADLGEAAAQIGIAEVQSAPGDTVRQYHLGNERYPSLPWAAARVAGLDVTKGNGARQADTWLNFYGPPLTLTWKSYFEVADQSPGFFRNKCVFVGARPKTLIVHQEADAFRTPTSSMFGGELFPGVEIAATAFLNLLRKDGLTPWSWDKQLLMVVGVGMLFGAGLGLLRPWVASALAALGILAILIVARVAYQQHGWFAWTIIAFGQIPAALAWSIGGQFIRLRFEKEVYKRAFDETTKLVEATKATAAQKPALFIPDHSLVRLVGRGAYGEVWLARNAIGAYHVVKLVKRRGFPSDEPYEREFRGIQKFMPISRTHAGFVHILHVGRNDEEKFYYCIMEAGDDRVCGQAINPDTYQPKTLSTEMEATGMIPPEQGLRLGIALSDALEHLHQHQLVHRDIKPPNIIYVHGTPKFADIGLVTDIAGNPKDISQIGTEGYMAPEGPGTPAADVYSLGKVLYEAIMGRDRRMFPEVPTAVFEQPSESLLRQLNDIIFRACEINPDRRYRSARELRDALRGIRNE